MDIALEGVKLLAPELVRNRKRYGELIRKHFRQITKNGISCNVSIYMSLFTHFKTGYTLEDITEKMCTILAPYRVGEQEDVIAYNKTRFTISTEYDYSDSIYATNELLDSDLPTDAEEEIVLPAVTGLTIAIFPEGDETKTQLMDGACFLEIVENALLEYHIVRKGAFLYIQTESTKDQLDILQLFERHAKKWDSNIRNLSSKRNEIKVKLDKLVSKSIGEML